MCVCTCVWQDLVLNDHENWYVIKHNQTFISMFQFKSVNYFGEFFALYITENFIFFSICSSEITFISRYKKKNLRQSILIHNTIFFISLCNYVVLIFSLFLQMWHDNWYFMIVK